MGFIEGGVGDSQKRKKSGAGKRMGKDSEMGHRSKEKMDKKIN